MGCLYAVPDAELGNSYVFKRDYLGGLDPVQDREFTFERFSGLLGSQNRMLKSVLIGKDAVVVGVSNMAFQEIAYKGRVHPKRKAADLDEGERRALYDAIREVLDERIRLKGKEDFIDLYGNPGMYKPIIASHMMGQPCPQCGTAVDKLAFGGGPTYFCPSCQR